MIFSGWFSGLAMAGGLLLAFPGFPGYHEVVIETGYRGEARRKPFLAAWRLLESRGWEVEERHGLSSLPGHDRVMVVTAGNEWRRSQRDAVADWVRAGGHLVYLMAGFEPYGFEAEAGMEDAGGELERIGKEAHPVLEKFGVRPVLRRNRTGECRIRGMRLEIGMPPGRGVEGPEAILGAPGVVRSEETGGAGVLSFPVDKGRLTVLGDARVWRNLEIGTMRHATLFWELIRLHGEPGGVWVVEGSDLSFSGLLWSRGWMPLSAFGLFVIGWLWRSLPRFGPVVPPPEPAARDFLSHLAQAGAFLWSRGGPDTLVMPLRRFILRNVHRATGEAVPGTLTGEQWESLSRLTGLSVVTLRQALFGEVPKQPRDGVELLSTLQKIVLSLS